MEEENQSSTSADEDCCGKNGSSSNDFVADTADDGIFDLEEVIEEEVNALSEVIRRMSDAIADVGKSMEERNQEINSLGIGDGVDQLSVQERKRFRARVQVILKYASGDMTRFASRIRAELPLFQQHLDGSIKTFARAVPIYFEFNEDRSDLKDVVITMLKSMNGMISGAEDFHDSLRDLPRLSSTLDAIETGCSTSYSSDHRNCTRWHDIAG